MQKGSLRVVFQHHQCSISRMQDQCPILQDSRPVLDLQDAPRLVESSAPPLPESKDPVAPPAPPESKDSVAHPPPSE